MKHPIRRRVLALPVVLGAAAAALVVAGGDQPPERSFADDYRPVAAAIATREAALESRAALVRDPERLRAVYRDARASTEQARRDLARLNSPETERLEALLARRARALTAVIEHRPGRGDAVRDLARISAQLRLHQEGNRP